MKLVPRYNYQPLERIKDRAGRLYQTPDGGRLPSVTTILDKTADKTFLKEWRNRIGHEEAAKISKTSANLGTAMHSMVEHYIKESKEPEGNLFARAMALSIIRGGLAKVDEVWGVEVGLFAKGLYGGTVDCVGLYEGAPSIIDFKNSRRLKKEDWVNDYKLQAVAYGLAHDEMFGTEIQQAVIMIATHDADYQEFVIRGDEYFKYAEQWGQRVNQYYQNQKS